MNPYHKPYVRNQRIILGLTVFAISLTGSVAVFAALNLLFDPLRYWWQVPLIVVLFCLALGCFAVAMAGKDVFKEIEGGK